MDAGGGRHDEPGKPRGIGGGAWRNVGLLAKLAIVLAVHVPPDDV